MPNYFDTLTKPQKNNIAVIINRMNQRDVINHFTQAAILSIVSKESAFLPQFEKDYSKTPNDRIRAVFGSHFTKYSEAALTTLKADPVKFFNVVYGGRYGNSATEGFMYRGGGLNQVTFKANYKQASEDSGVDLIKNPEHINEIAVAADALIGYFKRKIQTAPKDIFLHYKMSGTTINDFTDLINAVKCIYHANAGWGRTYDYLEADKTGGRKKALDRVDGFSRMIL